MVAPVEGDARRRESRSRVWGRAACRPALRTNTFQVEQLEELCQPALLATSASLPYAVAPSMPAAPNQVTLDNATLAAFANSPLQFRGQSLTSSVAATSTMARGPSLPLSVSAPGQFRLASTLPLQTPFLTGQSNSGTILNSATSVSTLATLGPQGFQSSQVPLVSQSGLSHGQRFELVIVDPRVANYQQLLRDMARIDPSRRLEVVVLRSDRDGVQHVTDVLARYQQLDAVHLISHGAANGIAIGNTWLSSLTIGSYRQQFQEWRLALAAHADLLFYGCNLAQSESGQSLLRDIRRWTGADVAASADATGSSSQGGNWRLEYSTGNIESAIPITLHAQSSWRGLLPVLATSLNQRVNFTTAGVQDTTMENRGSQNAVAIADNGKYVVVWSSQNQDGSGWGVYGQCFDPDGNSRGGEFRINQTTVNNQRWANVACDQNGDFVVTWTSENQDGTPASVYARVFNNNGNALTSEFRVNTTATGEQKNSAIAMDRATGDFVIAWAGEGPGDTAGVFFRRFSAGGIAKDAADQLANQFDAGTENDPSIAMTTASDFAIVWEVNKDICFQRFDGAGLMQGSHVQVNSALSTCSRPSVASDAAGTFTVVYHREILFTGVWIKSFYSDGSTHFGEQQVASGDADSPSVAMASTGEIIVTYHKTGDGSGLGVYGQHYDINGGAIGGAFAVNQYTNGNQANSSLAMIDSNDFVVVWSGEGSSSGPGPGDANGIFVRQFGGTNSAPVIVSNGGGNAASINVPENSSFVTTVAASDADLPAQKLTYSISGGADAAHFTIDATTGVLSFVSSPDVGNPTDVGNNNVYDVTVRVSDGFGGTDAQAISVRVTNVNDNAPVAINDAYIVNENNTLTVAGQGVLGNDFDIDGDAMTAFLVTGPANGSLTLNANGSFTYTPSINFSGSDSFSYRAYDGIFSSNVAFVTITVNPVNNAPVATNDAYSVNEDNTLTIAVPGILGNDTDPDGDILKSILVSSTSNGSLICIADGSFIYTPNADFNGVDTFTYQATDGLLNSNIVTVTINVRPINDAPLASNDSYSVNEDTALAVAALGILSNDIDIDGNALTAVLVSGTSNGTLVFNADGSFTYTPNANFNGVDSFSYRANDGKANSNRVIVSIRVNPGNDAPIAISDSYSLNEDTVLAIKATGILTNDTDVDRDPVKAILVSGPSFGTVTLNSDGSFTYTPNGDFNGTDSFTYMANDGKLSSSVATVTLNVKPVNDAPSALNDLHLGQEDSKLIVASIGVLGNDKDIDGDTLQVTLETGPRHGTLTLNANGTFTYVPEANYHGLDSFTYMAHDGLASSFAATVAIHLAPVNDAPVAIADRYTITSDTTLKVTVAGVLSNDSDLDDKQVTAILVGSTSHGTVTLKDDGSFVYVPNAKFHGTDTFTYRASDGQTQSKLVTVTIDVTAAVIVTLPPVTGGGPLPPVREIPPTKIEPTATNQIIPTPIVTVGPLVLGGATGSSDSDSGLAEAALALVSKPANPFAAVVTAPNPLGDRNIVGDRSSTSLTIHTPEPVAPLPTRSVVNLAADNPVFTALDQVSKDVRSEVKVQVVADAVVATGVVVSAGYVLLNTKIVYWFISALLVRPAVWTRFDPIDVLYAWDEGRDDEPEGTSDDESLQSMVS